MESKVTSIKIDKVLWGKVKMTAAERGISVQQLITLLLKSAMMSERSEELVQAQPKLLSILKEKRRSGEEPLIISSKKTVVELVKEGRGE